jgi:hypothetical protein
MLQCTRLLVDTLSVIHEGLLKYIVDNDESLDLSILGPSLDRLAQAITEIRVVGSVQHEVSTNERHQVGNLADVNASFQKNSSLSLGIQATETYEGSLQRHSMQSGIERHRIHFGSVRNELVGILERLTPKHVWILLDEWSEVPLDLQPYLADLLRRSVFPVHGVSIKIAAIEQRTNFRISQDETGYIGIEVGADAATSLNLDEFMVFDNDANRSKDFFRELLFKHIRPLFSEDKIKIDTPNDLIRNTFTQISAFDEFVRSAEGVPRDAINILGIAAQRANNEQISVPHIRLAAKLWYNRNKEAAVSTKPRAHDLLRWIIDEVISHRQARAFLLRSNIRDPLIDFLFDSRVLHVVKQSVSGHDEPGIRYNVFSIDYGCYVDLINTSKAPVALFSVDTEEGIQHIDVPQNDYRSIRRAILHLDKFYETNPI